MIDNKSTSLKGEARNRWINSSKAKNNNKTVNLYEKIGMMAC